MLESVLHVLHIKIYLLDSSHHHLLTSFKKILPTRMKPSLKFQDFALFPYEERRQSTSKLLNMISRVPTEYESVPSTSTSREDFDPELLKVEIKEEEEEKDDNETPDGSICSVSDVEDTPQSSFKNKTLGNRKQRISSERKVKVLAENKKFKCSYCGKNFCNKYSLSRHKWSHSKKTFSCTVCDKIFTNHESWLRHERMHQSGNRYKCSMCDKSYVSSTSYAAHLRKHTGERPYKCSDCEETFYLVSSFERHIAKHRGMKDFKCEICNAAFWVPDDLRAHVNRMH